MLELNKEEALLVARMIKVLVLVHEYHKGDAENDVSTKIFDYAYEG